MLDTIKLFKDAQLIFKILTRISPIIWDACSKIKTIVVEELNSANVPMSTLLTLAGGLLNGILKGHVENLNKEEK